MAGKVIAVVPAAGSGRRMGSSRAKQLLLLGGRPILTRTLQVLLDIAEVEGVVVSAPADSLDLVANTCLEPYGLSQAVVLVAGGKERQDSVHNGVTKALALGAGRVLVHDGVRPLAPPELFRRVLDAAGESGCAIGAIPCVDTIKQAGPEGWVEKTLDRSRLWQVQTPQAFDAALLAGALDKAKQAGFVATDEGGLMEWAGHRVRLVEGSRRNLKITTPDDLELARGWLGETDMPWRMGQGLDVHRLVNGRPLVLGGVEVPSSMGLLGHSDADVLTHAVMDALLAAVGMGDIGGMFPDSDPAFKGADSMELLSRVVQRLGEAGWRPQQVSVTLAAQRPKIAPHVEAMRDNLAARLGIEPGMVNVAATTSEELGFVGRSEGMAALATAVIVAVE